MKSLLVTALSLLIFCSVSAAGAQSKRGTTTNAQPFASFWSKFKMAVAKDDKEAVASMTKLPFPFDNKELTRAQFIKNYSRMFDRSIKRCFATAKPGRDGDAYSIFCGEQGILFERVGSEYKLTSFFAND
ncbi:MAG TPA: hypothetical protein VF666_09640 [Pyrinomonadaceae bacterium]